METPPQAEALPATPSSKEMLAHLISIVVPLLLCLQVVMFFGYRWVRVEWETFNHGSLTEWAINPWVVWLPVGILMLFVVLWRACRTDWMAWHRWVVGSSLVLSIGFAAWGLALKPRDRVYHPPSQEERWQLGAPNYRPPTYDF